VRKYKIGFGKESPKKSSWLAAAIALDVPFTNYGLDSILLVTLVDELEEWLGASLDPTIFWEYPTVEILTDWLLSADLSGN
jgi:acyl carrier protein